MIGSNQALDLRKACCGACLLQLNDPSADGAAEVQGPSLATQISTAGIEVALGKTAALTKAGEASVASRCSERLRNRAKAAAAIEGFVVLQTSFVQSAADCTQLGLLLCVLTQNLLIWTKAACTSSTSAASKSGLVWRTPARSVAPGFAVSVSTALCPASAGAGIG